MIERLILTNCEGIMHQAYLLHERDMVGYLFPVYSGESIFFPSNDQITDWR